MNSGLYSLIARNLDTNEFIVLPIEDRETKEIKKKVNVSSIDKITTYFNDEKHLINRLYNRGYINFTNADIFIAYKNNGNYKFLQPLYRNFDLFRGFANYSETKIDPKNDYFIYYQDIIFTELNKEEIRKYILNSSNINDKVKEHINLAYYLDNLEQVTHFKRKLIEDLTNYRIIRDMVMNINEFYNPKLKEERLSRSEDRRRAIGKQLSKQDLLAHTMNIVIPSNFKSEEHKEKILESAEIYKKENEEIREMIDLDDVIYSLTDDEALALGIDKRKMDEYVEKARK